MEDEEEPDEVFQQPSASTSRRKLLLPSLNSSVRRGSLSSLLGDELCQVSALRHSCPSPARGSPSPRCRRDPRLPERDGGVGRSPPKLLIRSLHTYGPPDLSPRYGWDARGPGEPLGWRQRGEGGDAGRSSPPPALESWMGLRTTEGHRSYKPSASTWTRRPWSRRGTPSAQVRPGKVALGRGGLAGHCPCPPQQGLTQATQPWCWRRRR